MSYFEFGFPVPEAPADPATEWCMVNGKASPVGPYMPLGDSAQRVCDRETERGYFYRSGNGTFAPTWMAVLRSYPVLHGLLTNAN